ncbi:MAG: hypothetical protein HY313_03950 [Acidobacteria bacterium]|nr:hypothetical protein [Acidobacteriota bacterium]
MGYPLEQFGSMAALEALLRQRICSICVDRNMDGTCSLNQRNDCALFDRFPRIVRSISRVNSEKIDDYVTAIREDVCADCINQALDGSCKLRDEVRCVLDRYLLLIIGVIEEAKRITLKQGKIVSLV